MAETSSSCSECGAPGVSYWPRGLCPQCAVDGALGMTHVGTQVIGPEWPALWVRVEPPPSSEESDFVGSFGDYDLLEEIARGGMGIVYKARQRNLGRIVAVKLILAGPLAAREFVQRFRTEASAAAVLQHPNIVSIHDVGVHQGQHYFSMDYVEGRNLAQLVGQQPLTAHKAARYVALIAEAIHYAHEQGILHRDLKPSNVLIDDHDQPRITDFGLARRLDGESSLTMPGQVLGSPNFMPPEQAGSTSGAVGRPSDVYALGGILYYLLTARAPFQGESLEQVITQVLNAEPVPPRLLNPSIPRDLETIALKCLEKEPSRRYPTAQQLAEELSRVQRQEPILARPVNAAEKLWRWCRRKPALAGTMGAAVAALLIGLGTTSWQWRRAEGNAAAEHLQRKRAETGESNALRQLYVNRMNVVQAAWERNDVSRVRRLLQETAPSPERGFEWYYWQRQTHLEEISLRGHIDSVLAVAYSKDGRWIVTGSADLTARVWDAASGKEMHDLRRHTGPICSVAFSHDGQWIVTGSWDRSAMVWEAATGKWLRTLPHDDEVFTVAISKDGQRIATGSRDGTARIWDAVSGDPIHTFHCHTGVIWSVAFSPDGGRIVTGSWDKTAKVWTTSSDTPSVTFSGHHDPVFSVAFSPDGERIVSGGFDRMGRVWEAATGKELAILEGHNAPVFSSAFSPDGKRIATAGQDQTARVWDAGGRYELLAIKKHGSQISSAAFSADSTRIATGGGGFAISPDSVVIFARGGDQTTRVWQVTNDEERHALRGHTGSVLSVAYSRDGQWIVTGSMDKTAKIWEAASGRVIRTLDGHNGHTEPVQEVAISPDRQRIVTGSSDMTAKVWNATTGEWLFTLQHDVPILSVGFSAHGKQIAIAGQGPVTRVWDVTSRMELLPLKQDAGWVWSVAFSPNGLEVLTANGDAGNTATVWDTRTGTPRPSLKGHTSWLLSAAFSADGRRIVTSSDDESVRVWDAASGKQLQVLNGHSDQIMSVAFSPDGKRVVSGSRDQSVKVWDVATGQELLTLGGRIGWVFSVAFSPDGKQIAAGTWDGTIRRWDAASAQQVAQWHTEEQSAAASQQIERSAAAAESERIRALQGDQPGGDGR